MALSFVYLTHASKIKTVKSKSFVVGKAIGELLDALHMEFPSKVLTMNMNEKNYFLDEVHNEIQRWTNAPTQIYNYRAKKNYTYDSFSSVILSSNQPLFYKFFKTHFEQDTLKMINSKVKRRTRTYQREFLLIYSSTVSTYFDDSHIYGTEFSDFTQRYHFKLETFSNDSLGLYQKVCLEDTKCECRMVSLNNFNIQAKKWNKKTFKFKMPSKSFNYCPMNYFNFAEQHAKTKSIIQMLNQNFVRTFAQHHNMQLIGNTDTDEDYQFYIANGKQYLEENSLIGEYVSGCHMTSPLSISNLRFAVTRGLAYTPAEKMILPFDTWTWILICVSVVIGFIVIFALTKIICIPPLRRFTLGKSNIDPFFNLVRIFFGVDLVYVPSENCARFFITIFTLYCFIFRTVYQGKMFDFMTMKITKSTPQSIQELFERKIPLIDLYNDHETKNVKLNDSSFM